MRGLCLSLVVCLGAAPLGVASPGLDDDPSPATVAYRTIMAEYDAAMAAYRQAFAELRATPEYQEANKNRDRDALTKLSAGIQRVDSGAYAKRQLDAARQHAASEDAIPALNWAMKYTRSNDVRNQALELLLANHADSEAMLPFARDLYRMGRSFGTEGCAKIMEALMANPSKEVQAHALYGWAYQILNDRSGSATPEQKAEAEAAMVRVKELAPNSSCAMRIGAEEFEKTRLQIGMEVPDIAGRDLDGVNFKLSDYRGKVVVLDFWGDW